LPSAAVGALLLALLAGCGSGGGPAVATTSLNVGILRPPAPPRGAVVLAGASGSRAVALAVAPSRLVATVIAPSGEPLSGLELTFRVGSRVLPARACGAGCYAADAAGATAVEVRPGGSRPVAFSLPRSAPSAAAIVARAARVTRSLQSLEYVESLRSGPSGGLVSTWRMRAPNQVEYDIRGGASAIVIGQRRWDRDRPGRPWRRSQQLPPLRVPQPAWTTPVRNAHLLGTSRVDGRTVWIVSFSNPATPAWFTAWIERSSYRTQRLKMTAPAHFMVHRYLAFDRPLRIAPPR
jgi:hypothetical protein